MNVWEIEKLIEEHGTDIYRFCRKLALTQSDTDDLYQQTFLKALEIQSQIRIHQNPKSFLIGIAISIWKNHMRKNARRQRIAPIVNLDAQEYEGLASEMCIEDRVFSSDIQAQVREIIQQLNDKLRVPILLYYTEELTIEQIATLLHIPQGTIKSRLHKGRLWIKKELEEKGYDTYR